MSFQIKLTARKMHNVLPITVLVVVAVLATLCDPTEGQSEVAVASRLPRRVEFRFRVRARARSIRSTKNMEKKAREMSQAIWGNPKPKGGVSAKGRIIGRLIKRKLKELLHKIVRALCKGLNAVLKFVCMVLKLAPRAASAACSVFGPGRAVCTSALVAARAACNGGVVNLTNKACQSLIHRLSTNTL